MRKLVKSAPLKARRSMPLPSTTRSSAPMRPTRQSSPKGKITPPTWGKKPQPSKKFKRPNYKGANFIK